MQIYISITETVKRKIRTGKVQKACGEGAIQPALNLKHFYIEQK